MASTPFQKRLFFAFEAHAPWPALFPKGRVLEVNARHLTIAFLGDTDYLSLKKIIEKVPKPPFIIGPVGMFDRCLFLPPQRPNVVSWQVNWFTENIDLRVYQKHLSNWLFENGFSVNLHKTGFLPHVTLCRRPFDYKEWREGFTSLPLFIKDLHLYESKSGLNYIPLWTHSLQTPFDLKLEGTKILVTARGESLSSLFTNSLAAIAFYYPEILEIFPEKHAIENASELLSSMEGFISTSGKINPSIPRKLEIIDAINSTDELKSWKFRVY